MNLEKLNDTNLAVAKFGLGLNLFGALLNGLNGFGGWMWMNILGSIASACLLTLFWRQQQ